MLPLTYGFSGGLTLADFGRGVVPFEPEAGMLQGRLGGLASTLAGDADVESPPLPAPESGSGALVLVGLRDGGLMARRGLMP